MGNTVDAKLHGLSELSNRINLAHAELSVSLKNTVEKAFSLGAVLVDAKEQVPHGQWEEWVAFNTSLKIRQCQRYMRLAENWEAIRLNAPTTIEEALDSVSVVVPKATLPSYLEEENEFTDTTQADDEERDAYHDENEYEDEDEFATDGGPDEDVSMSWHVIAEQNDAPITTLCGELRTLRSRLNSLNSPWMKFAIDAVRANLSAAINSLNSATSAECCDRCDGVGCEHCLDTGYLSKDAAKRRSAR